MAMNRKMRHSSRSTQKLSTTEEMREQTSSPPPAPTALPFRQSAAFEVNNVADNNIEIKLAIEFPLKGENIQTM